VSVYRQAITNLGFDLNTQVTEENYAQIQAEADRIRAGAGTPPPSTDPRRAAPIEVSDLQLQLAVLREAGMDEADAYRAIATGQGRPTAEMMATKKAELQARANAEAEARWNASPEGRTAAAHEALAQKEADARLAKGARELIRDQWGDAVDTMPVNDVLVNAGIRESENAKREREVYEASVRLLGDRVPTDPNPISTGTNLYKEAI
jgi:hypothetical protein